MSDPSAHAADDGDLRWLEAAVDLAAQNVRAGGGPFGAIVVRNGRRVSSGQNRVTRDNDPTAHAEVEAIRAAGRALGTFDLSGTVLYSSCEPCPLCISAALWGRVERVVFAANKHDAAAAGFDDSAFYELLATDRASWSMPRVEERRTADAAEPFLLWARDEGRIRY
ncbi:nucleoside deaminase [Gryllotalpicola ginsengisoli]|uniref:nucleoside deaminase n=1 Tax=Gryllotalpicola ginsengisoli TaxID=444608 RepID=UPI0003B36CA8|nr:nucleoside deaminase [Gryllotalpicola ginsengisoli]